MHGLVSHKSSARQRRNGPVPISAWRLRRTRATALSAALDFGKYIFLNCDLTINLFRRPEGEWLCLEARTLFGGHGCGLAESAPV